MNPDNIDALLRKYIVEIKYYDGRYVKEEFHGKNKAQWWLMLMIKDEFERNGTMLPYRVTECDRPLPNKIILQSCWEDE